MRYNRAELHKHCAKYKIEHGEVRAENRIIFFCPEMPDEKIKIKLVSIIPKETKYQFIVGPKISTRDTLILLFGNLGVSPSNIMKIITTIAEKAEEGCRHLPIELNNVQIADDHPFWNEIGKILAQDGFYKTWTITLGDKTITEKTMKIAAEISKHHNIRDHTILEDDMVNLKISLGKEQDVLDFLKDLENETR
jgi:hypothetical protein